MLLLTQTLTETEIAWAQFRIAHRELYSEEFRRSAWWPFVEPQGRA